MSNPLASTECSIRSYTGSRMYLREAVVNGSGAGEALTLEALVDGGALASPTKDAAITSGETRLWFRIDQNPSQVPSAGFQVDATGGEVPADTAVFNVVSDRAALCRLVGGEAKLMLPAGDLTPAADLAKAFVAVQGVLVPNNTRVSAVAAAFECTGDITEGSTTISNLSPTVFPQEGQQITHQVGEFDDPGIPSGAYITTPTAGGAVASLEMSTPATSTQVGITIRFGAVATIDNTPSVDGLQSVVFAGFCDLVAAATGTTANGDFTFEPTVAGYSNKPLTDLRDGDQVEVAYPVQDWNAFTGYTSLWYVVLEAYAFDIRHNARGSRFSLFKDPQGSDTFTESDLPIGEFIGSGSGTSRVIYGGTDATHYVNVYQSPEVPFDPNSRRASIQVTGTLTRGAESITPRRRAHLIGSKVRLRYAAANEYIKLKLAGSLRGNAVTLGRKENDVPLAASYRASLGVGPALLSGGTVLLSPAAQRLVASGMAKVTRGPVVGGLTPSARLVTSNPKLLGHEDMQAKGRIMGRGSARILIEGQGLTVLGLARDTFSMWNKKNPFTASQEYQDRFIRDLNSALQLIWSQAEQLNYFNRTTEEIAIGAGETSATLPGPVQKALGNVRTKAEKRPLFLASSLAELEQAEDLLGIEDGNPILAYVDARAQSEWDATKLTLHVRPAPAAGDTFEIECVREAPRYSWRDVQLNTPLRQAHAYAEALLMPLVRERAMTFRFFIDEEKREEIVKQGAEARSILGLLQPEPEAQVEEEATR